MKAKLSHIVILTLALMFAVSFTAALVGCPQQDGGEDVTPAPPMEEPPMPAEGAAGTSGETGKITMIGSTTVLPAAEKWAQAYNEENPNIDIEVSGGGSGTGIGALIEGTTDIANASRPIKKEEKTNAEKNGINPVEHVVAHDGIAVIVNPANPVSQLSIEQLSDIFSGKVTDWGEYGGEGEIVIVSRDSSSGTYEAFKEMIVQIGESDTSRDFAPSALKQASNQAVYSTVSKTDQAIGYISLAYLDDEIKTVAVQPMDGGNAVKPTKETIQDGSYPISRPLYCYTDGEPTGAVKGFMNYIKGDGQELVTEVGYVPID